MKQAYVITRPGTMIENMEKSVLWCITFIKPENDKLRTLWYSSQMQM